jgi:hypothetical protein
MCRPASASRPPDAQWKLFLFIFQVGHMALHPVGDAGHKTSNLLIHVGGVQTIPFFSFSNQCHRTLIHKHTSRVAITGSRPKIVPQSSATFVHKRTKSYIENWSSVYDTWYIKDLQGMQKKKVGTIVRGTLLSYTAACGTEIAACTFSAVCRSAATQ